MENSGILRSLPENRNGEVAGATGGKQKGRATARPFRMN
jgi:hypothetical protein